MRYLTRSSGTNRKYPAHIAINGRCNNTGFVLCEQLKAIDYEKGVVRLIDRASDELLD